MTGITGGLVSSTAVTLSFAKRGRDEPQAAPALACGILIAWAVMFGRILGLVLAVNRDLLWPLLPSILAMGAVSVVGGWLLYRRSGDAQGQDDVPLRNPFSLTSAVKFGLLFAAVLLLVKLVQFYFPGGGVYILAALAGLTDVDAITLSMADYARSNPANVAALAIVIAAVSNTVVKCAMVTSLGGPALRRPVLLATVAIVVAAVVGAAATWPYQPD